MREPHLSCRAGLYSSWKANDSQSEVRELRTERIHYCGCFVSAKQTCKFYHMNQVNMDFSSNLDSATFWNIFIKTKFFYRLHLEFPSRRSRNKSNQGSMRLQVQSLASLSGLRIQGCCELWCRLQTRFGSGIAVAVVEASSGCSISTLILGTSICCGCGSKKQKPKTKKTPNRLHLQHMEVPGLGVASEEQLEPTPQPKPATPDPSYTCDLCRSLWQLQILNPMIEARDQTHILTDTMSGS